jgi:hypothetical protein
VKTVSQLVQLINENVFLFWVDVANHGFNQRHRDALDLVPDTADESDELAESMQDFESNQK